MTASATKCYRTGCVHPPSLLLWVRHHWVDATGWPTPHLAVERQDLACEAHAIEDDDAGHVRRAIRLPKE
jgi:hypothetical protein